MTASTAAAALPPRAAAAPEPIAAGVYDMPADVYHARRDSLSSSGARKLLPPSCPALFRHEQDNAPEYRNHFDFGTAAHRMVLGDGPELVVVDAPDWRGKDAKAQRAEARERGAVALLPDDHARVLAMAAALAEHPFAPDLFANGRPEQSLFWTDPQTGVQRRARTDWLPSQRAERLIIPDYKTCRDASPAALAKAMNEYGYHQQAAWYLDGAVALDLADERATFLFVCQMKEPPFLVTVVEPDAMALRIGRALNRQAIETYRDCVAADHWPAWSEDVVSIGLPPWVENQFFEENS
ncbi:PD-(D/E)XK nuclease-like domain-containing protein [Embleya sp. NPDC001921]